MAQQVGGPGREHTRTLLLAVSATAAAVVCFSWWYSKSKTAQRQQPQLKQEHCSTSTTEGSTHTTLCKESDTQSRPRPSTERAKLVPVLQSSTPAEDWLELLPSHVELCRTAIGAPVGGYTGGFGKVYKGVKQGHAVALKVFPRDSAPTVSKEVEALDAHPNIVPLVEIVRDKAHKIIVSEWCDGGDLWELLHGSSRNADLLWYTRDDKGNAKGVGRGRQIALDIARGLQHIHRKGIRHLDLKSPNVLLAADGTAKVADIGQVCAKLINPKDRVDRRAVDNMAWAAPEVILATAQQSTEKADIYSLGVIMHELIIGRNPSRNDLRPVKSPEDCPEEVAELLARCLSVDPFKRPGAGELVMLLAREDLGLGTTQAQRAAAAAATGRPHNPQRPWRTRPVKQRSSQFLDSIVDYHFTVVGPDCGFTYDDARRVEVDKGDMAPYLDAIKLMKEMLARDDVEDPRSASSRRLRDLVDSCQRFTACMQAEETTLMRKLQSKNVAKLHVESMSWANVEKDMGKVVDALQLTAEQEEELLRVYARFLSDTKTLETRRSLLKDLMHRSSKDHQTRAEGVSGFVTNLKELNATIQEGNNLLSRFYSNTISGETSHIISPVQDARARVTAFPWLPDPVAICTIVQERRGRPIRHDSWK